MDKIFKIGILVLGFCYLAYLFCPISNQAGRYRFISPWKDTIGIMDTANADLYTLSVDLEKWIKTNPKTDKYIGVNAEINFEKLKKKLIDKNK